MNVSISTAGLVVTVYAATVVIGGPLLTAVTVRLPRRALMFGLMGLFVAGNLLAAAATNFTVLLIARGLTALIHATFFAVCIVIASTIVPADRQGRALANVALGLNLATVLGVPIGTLIGNSTSWRGTFVFLACFGAAATVFLMWAVRIPSLPGSESIRSELRVFGNRGVVAAIAMTALGAACWPRSSPP